VTIQEPIVTKTNGVASTTWQNFNTSKNIDVFAKLTPSLVVVGKKDDDSVNIDDDSLFSMSIDQSADIVAGIPAEEGDFVTTVLAEIQQLRGFDRANAQAIWPGADFTITIRYIPGIKANMRLVDENGKIYSILGTPEDIDGRHKEIVMTCQSGVKAS